ncbi:hypothetical protein F183_A21420 [Bryobacterales bacterium F-183]|nr:hypothetical protein F183_A21420 [Bryobacterales bacterium F-183]
MLRLTHLGVILAVLLAFRQAPFEHWHESDSDYVHAHGFTHFHLGDHDEDHAHLAAINDHDGAASTRADFGADARFTDSFTGIKKNAAKIIPALPEGPFSVQLCSESKLFASFV